MTWSIINIIYRFSKKRIGSELQVKYFFLLVYKREYRGKLASSPRRALAYLIMALYIVTLAWSIYTTIATIYSGLIRGQREVVVLLPGLNITGLDLVYFLLSVFIGVSLHEYLHAKIALRSSVPVKSYGFLLALIVPAAFVEIDEEVFKRVGKTTKIAILSAGVVGNLVLVLLVLAFLVFARPLMISHYGFTVLEVEQNSLAQEYGLRQYDVVLMLNNKYATLEYLRELLSINETIVIEMEVYRDGAGFIRLAIVKPHNITRLGIVVDQAPSRSTLGVIPVWLIVAIMRQVQWLYIVNFSLMYINSIPLFITDGGRIVIDLLGERKGVIVNTMFLALVATMLILNARV